MRLLGRLLAVLGLVAAGGLALPGGAAQAAACSGTSGVTVVIDFGSSTSTRCAPESSSAMQALNAVAAVTYPPQYVGTVVCQIDHVPSQQCTRMPPSSAYWAFFHARRGGSWTYSSTGAASYDPPPGSVVGFAFGSGGAPSPPPPAAVAAPTPTPKPAPSASTTSTKRTSTTTPAPAPRTPVAATPRASSSVPPHGSTTTARPRPRASSPTPTSSSATTTTTTTTRSDPSATTPGAGSSSGRAAARAATPGSTGGRGTLLAGIGLVTLVGAGAAYLAVRRRGHG